MKLVMLNSHTTGYLYHTLGILRHRLGGSVVEFPTLHKRMRYRQFVTSVCLMGIIRLHMITSASPGKSCNVTSSEKGDKSGKVIRIKSLLLNFIPKIECFYKTKYIAVIFT